MSYNIAILGTGIGKAHAEALKLFPDFVVKTICGKNSEKTEAIAKSLGIPNWLTNYSEVINDQEIDIVLIALPNDLHLQVVSQAVSQGKYIVLEKPSAPNVSDAQALVMLSQTSKFPIVIHHQLRFHPILNKIQKMITAGTLGEVAMINIIMTRKSDEYFSWMNQLQHGGGQLQLMGSHLIDLTRFWLENTNWEDVSLKANIVVNEVKDHSGIMQKVTAEDQFVIAARSGNTLISLVNGTRGFAYKGFTIEVQGTKAAVFYNQETGFRFTNNGDSFEALTFTDQFPAQNTENNFFRTGMKYFWAEYLNALKTKDFSKFSSVNDGVEIQKIIAQKRS
ncbi:MAG: Gfo/Idh/MocA family oxidoreductase [bacterium]